MIGSAQAALLGISKAPKTWDLTVTTTDVSQDYTVDIYAGTSPNINIDWGDGGAVENFTSTGQKTHTYSAAGTYTVKISGSFSVNGNIRLGSNAANRARLINTKAVCYIPGLKTFSSTFQDCTGFVGPIPSNLFRYNPQLNFSDTFLSTFRGCTNLTGSIPQDLFRYNRLGTGNGFNQTFSGCSSLTGSIPADLFRYSTLVSSSAFNYCFYNCSGLTGSIPADLFRYNTAVSSNGFYATFLGCSGLTGPIPADLFRYNTLCNSFYRTFYGCNKLEPSAYIFFASGEEGTRFLNQTVDFTECFRLTAAYGGAQGTAPALWDCTFGTGTPTTTDCFQGHDASSLSNWASIPAAWT